MGSYRKTVKSLLETHPELCKEWHPTKNKNLLTTQVSKGMSIRVWWKCKKDHEWNTKISHRTLDKSECPYCVRQKLKVNLFNNLEITFPEIAKEWHPTKNNKTLPTDVGYGSSKKMWWICNKGHEWNSPVIKRTLKGRSCPHCRNDKIKAKIKSKCTNSVRHPKKINLEIEYPSLYKEWHPTKNHLLSPNNIIKSIYTKFWWLCNKGHEYKDTVTNRINGLTCPYCSNNNKLLDKFPQLIKEWHPSLNKEEPYKFNCRSHKNVWWICDKGHSYEMKINNKIRINKKDVKIFGCPYCSNHRVNKENCLSVTHPKICSEWDYTKNKINPENITYGSKIYIWWICNKGHSWKADLPSRTIGGNKCPYCVNQKVNWDNCLENKFPEIANEWDYSKNDTKPIDTIAGSNKYAWWLCDKGHSYRARINHRTFSKSGCPYCLYKTQELCRKIFEDIFNEKFIQIRPKWLKNPKTNYPLELDGYNKKLQLAFEYDGEQHFKNTYKTKNGFGLEYTKEKDAIKDKLCLENGVTLIRIPYTEKNNLNTYIKEQLKIKGVIK